MAGRSDRRRFRRLVALLAAAGITPGLSACGAPDTISLSGQVDDRLVVVQAPDLIVPMPDPDAGFAAGTRTSSDSSASTNDATSAATAIGSITAIGSQHPISDVEVHLGQSVTVGQVLLRLDDATLRSGTAMAAADETVAARQVPVLDSAIDETYARQHDIEKALDKVADAIDQLTTTRARLQTQLSAATQQLPQL
ncbi:MAG TPA: hypothetical protein VFP34_17040, partial [Microlunatus sp.]|nr:hypothetical protein [Microlunatus sp.]